MSQNKKLIELFAGCGGLALGLEKAGFQSVLLNEINKDACHTLKFNRPKWNVIEKDIKNINFKNFHDEIDLISGGFPCQAFSYAGKQLGFNDIRGTLFFEFARIINEVNPKSFLLENVKGLITHDNGKTLETIINVINEIGYTLIEKSLYKATDYNVPQKRERIILIGIRNDLLNKVNYIIPVKHNIKPTMQDVLFAGNLYSTDVPSSIGQIYPTRKKEILDMVPQGGNWRSLPYDIQVEYMKNSLHNGGGNTGCARRLSLNEPSSTLTCSPAQKQTEQCHPLVTRPLTIREYARIQTFPDDWEFKGSMSSIYKQIGNAVPVNMSYAIGQSLMSMLNDV